MGRASGENRAVDAAKSAIDSPLLELSIEGAKGVLFTISGPKDLSMNEVNEAARLITASVDAGAKIIFGSTVNEDSKDEISITVIATGFGEETKKRDSKFDGLSAFSTPTKTSSPAYMPQVGKEAPYQDEPAEAPKETKKKKSKITVKNKDEEENLDESGEDLEIPAFIRRKMK